MVRIRLRRDKLAGSASTKTSTSTPCPGTPGKTRSEYSTSTLSVDTYVDMSIVSSGTSPFTLHPSPIHPYLSGGRGCAGGVNAELVNAHPPPLLRSNISCSPCRRRSMPLLYAQPVTSFKLPPSFTPSRFFFSCNVVAVAVVPSGAPALYVPLNKAIRFSYLAVDRLDLGYSVPHNPYFRACFLDIASQRAG